MIYGDQVNGDDEKGRAGTQIGTVGIAEGGVYMFVRSKDLSLGAVACPGGVLAVSSAPANAWEPTHPIEIIVPAGTGGGADD